MKILLFFLMIVSAQAAVLINWQSDFGETNRQSDGVTPLDGGFTFSLGGFKNDFIPTVDNVADWSVMWESLENVSYNATNNFFSEGSTLNANDVPFRTTDKVYMWGYNGLTSGSEWILISASAWEWPAAGSGPPIPGSGSTFLVASATAGEAVLGAVNSGGFHMQTERVMFPLSYADWVTEQFPGGGQTAPNDDPDGDGRSNLLEYAVDSNPNSLGDLPVLVITSDYRLVITRVPGRSVLWTLEKGQTLQDFTPLTDGVQILTDEPDQLIYQVTDLSMDRRFFRAVVTTDN